MSELRADTITASDGTSPVTLTKQSAAKAWIHFLGNAATVGVLDGLNHASISDLGSGRYSVSFTNSFNNATYASNVTGSTQRTGTNDTDSHATSGITYEIVNENGAFTDCKQGQAVVHGDLA